MNEKISHLTDALKAKRQKDGLSQSELSQKLGIPQSHVSKIENGSTDLRTTSLVEMARALGLEVMLVPRQLVVSVSGLTRAALDQRTPVQESHPAYMPDEEIDEDE